jgi:hypothetical protein
VTAAGYTASIKSWDNTLLLLLKWRLTTIGSGHCLVQGRLQEQQWSHAVAVACRVWQRTTLTAVVTPVPHTTCWCPTQ